MLSLTDEHDDRPAADRLQAAHTLAVAAREYVEVTQPSLALQATDVDPRQALLDVVSLWRTRAPIVPVQVDEPTVILPTMRSDRRWLQRTIDLVLGLAIAGAATEGGQVRACIRLGRGFLAIQLSWDGRPLFDGVPGDRQARSADILRVSSDALRWHAHDPYADARRWVSAVDLPLARALASRQGGELRIEAAGAPDITREMLLVFPVDVDHD